MLHHWWALSASALSGGCREFLTKQLNKTGTYTRLFLNKQCPGMQAKKWLEVRSPVWTGEDQDSSRRNVFFSPEALFTHLCQAMGTRFGQAGFQMGLGQGSSYRETVGWSLWISVSELKIKANTREGEGCWIQFVWFSQQSEDLRYQFWQLFSGILTLVWALRIINMTVAMLNQLAEDNCLQWQDTRLVIKIKSYLPVLGVMKNLQH